MFIAISRATCCWGIFLLISTHIIFPSWFILCLTPLYGSFLHCFHVKSMSQHPGWPHCHRNTLLLPTVFLTSGLCTEKSYLPFSWASSGFVQTSNPWVLLLIWRVTEAQHSRTTKISRWNTFPQVGGSEGHPLMSKDPPQKKNPTNC